MKVLHDFSKEVIETIKSIGVIVNDFDEHGNLINYYNLPQWFKDVNGHILECSFDELPDSAKQVHLKYRDYQRVFTLDEMKACALEMANWGEGFEGALTPNEYFKQTFGIDISEK